jgi:hypothetical protein
MELKFGFPNRSGRSYVKVKAINPENGRFHQVKAKEDPTSEHIYRRRDSKNV